MKYIIVPELRNILLQIKEYSPGINKDKKIYYVHQKF